MPSTTSRPRATKERTIHLTNNTAYLNWEMQRIRERARSYEEACASGDARVFEALLVEQAHERLEMIEARRRACAEGVVIPFEGISRRCGLRPIEETILVMAMAPHLSASTRRALLRSQGGGKGHVEVGFLSELLQPSRDGVTARAWADADSTLVLRGLLSVTPPPMEHPTSRLGFAAQTPHFLAAAALGEIALDEKLSDCATLRPPRRGLDEVILTEESRCQVASFIEQMEASRSGACVALQGGRQLGKSALAEALAGAWGGLLLTLDASVLAEHRGVEGLLELAASNAGFQGAVLHVTRPEVLLARQPSLSGALSRLIERSMTPVILEIQDASAMEEHLPASAHRVDFQPTNIALRERLWASLLPPGVSLDGTPEALRALAADVELSGGQIAATIEQARRAAASRGEEHRLRMADLEVGARAQLRSRIGELARASDAQLGLEDLVLPGAQREQVDALLSACRHRQRLLYEWGFGARLVTGRGLVALFCGEAGTGKTLTAEILAKELGQTLHIVSLPQIVSKWVGETEKNVREVFRQARASNSMLLFDEADALFGKRVKVERSQDHFQNMEVNNLLQEIERFDGVVILTTNLEMNMDPAFARRILFKIEFPQPGAEERSEIWRRLIPAQTPTEADLDFEDLGECYELSGGQIKNAIVRAAYRCLAERSPLTLDQLHEAAQQEARATGQLTRRFH